MCKKAKTELTSVSIEMASTTLITAKQDIRTTFQDKIAKLGKKYGFDFIIIISLFHYLLTVITFFFQVEPLDYSQE